MVSPWEEQIGGNHYKSKKIQPAYFSYVNGLGFIEGNIIKYVCREKGKRIEDLKKAKHYLDLLIYEETQKTPLKSNLEDYLPQDKSKLVDG